jgi:hypothetical protein
MATAFEPIRPVPPITTIFMVDPPLLTTGDFQMRIQVRKNPASMRVRYTNP